MQRQIVAVALFTGEELALLGLSFSRAYPVIETPCYGALLAAVDEADRALWRLRDEATPDAGPAFTIQILT